MIATFDLIKANIDRNVYTHAKLYDGFRDIAERDPVEWIKTSSPDELVQRLDYYRSNAPGKFIIQFGSSLTALRTSPRTIKTDFTPTVEIMSETLDGMPNQSVIQLTATITAQVREEFAKEQAIKTQLEEGKIKDDRIAELETGAGKIAEIFSQLAMKFLVPGESVEPVAPMQGSPDVTKEDLNDALIILVNEIGAETIIKLSKKLTPELVNTVRMFANN